MVSGLETKYNTNRILHKTLGNISIENGIRYNFKDNEGKSYKNRINSYEIFFKLESENELEFIKMSKNMSKINWRWDKEACEIIIILPDRLTLPNIKAKFRKLLELHVFGAIGVDEVEDDTIYFKHGTENFKTLEMEDILFAFPDADLTKLIPNDIHYIYKTLGIEAVRNYLVKEIPKVLSQEGIELDHRHILLLVDNMTCEGFIKSNKYSGIKLKESVFLKATFEQATKTFSKAAASSQTEYLQNVSAQLVVGKTPTIGSNVITCMPVYKEVSAVVERTPSPQPPSETFSPEYAPMEEDKESVISDGDVEFIPASPLVEEPVEIIEPTFLD